jgi:hypothetical protein
MWPISKLFEAVLLFGDGSHRHLHLLAQQQRCPCIYYLRNTHGVQLA